MAVPAVTAALLLLAASTVQISAAALDAALQAAALDAAASGAGVEFCGVSAVHLPTTSSESSLQLDLADLASSPPRPCRLEVTVPPSYELGVTLVLAAPAAPDSDEEPDQYDDAFDSRGGLAAILEAGARLENRTMTPQNYGRMMAESMAESASRQSNNANASCTLALYIKNEVAWSVDLCDERSVQAAKPHISSLPHNLSLTWTPPQDGRALRVSAVALTAVRKGLRTENLCTVGPVRLAGKGLESTIALELRDHRPIEDRVGPCRVSVAAPPGYQLSLVVVNKALAAPTTSPSSNGDVSLDEMLTSEPSPSCTLSLVPGCDVLFSVDLCRPASTANLNYSEWSPNNVTLEWVPPAGSHRAAQVADTVILTAVGRGDMCKHSHFTACQQRPRFQHFCVAAELACDGYPNCPFDGRDEDPGKCRTSAGLIEVPRQDRPAVVDVGPSDARHIIMDLLRGLDPNRTATPQADAIPDTLSNYGPWGYLMLGMLVCGAFLMLCGLWECCCRQPKATASSSHPSHTPTTVLMPQMGVTGGVLVLDSDLEDDPSRPPAYEDLDQPPAYGALFPPGVIPGQPKDDVIAPAVSLPASLDAPFADDAHSLSASTSSMGSSTGSSMATASSLSLS